MSQQKTARMSRKNGKNVMRGCKHQPKSVSSELPEIAERAIGLHKNPAK